MAAFNGRASAHGPLYSNISNLNTIPSDYDIAMQQQQDGYNMQADLDMFTNTQFFDFDMGESEVDGLIKGVPANTAHGLDLDFLNAGQPYNAFPHLINTHHNTIPPVARPHSQHLHHHLQQVPQSAFASATSSPTSTGTPLTLPVVAPTSEKQNQTRKLDTASTSAYSLDPTSSASATPGPPGSAFEEASRAAAEEDKRRRNTAASARFRVKKKQREQALEKASREMSDRVSFLEARVAQLEMENRLLKELVVEKGGPGGGGAEVQALERKVGARKIIGGTTKPGTLVVGGGKLEDDGNDEFEGEDEDEDDA